MGAGEDIAAAKQTVAGILKKSLHSLALVVDVYASTVDGNYQKKAARTSTTTLATIGQSCSVSGASFQRMQSNPKVKAGDKVFKVPGPFLTEALLRTAGAYLTYGDEALEIVEAKPLKVSFGAVVEWEIIARTKEFA